MQERRAVGALALFLHAHLPFVRHPEHEDFLEEDWLYEAIADSYLPLLASFERLDREDVAFRLTLSVSPPLAHMLRDRLLCARAARYFDRRAALLDREIGQRRADARLRGLALHHRERIENAISLWRRWGGDLVGAFANLAAHGRIELCTTAATHAYFPAWRAHPEAIRAQIGIAVDAHARTFGHPPLGFWLPECGYFPGLDRMLAGAGLRYCVLDATGLLLARPQPRDGVYAPVYTSSGLAAFGRDPESSSQVWSRESGYPADPVYRDFYRDLGLDGEAASLGPLAGRRTGVRYHRITGPAPDKDLYDSQSASDRAALHAAHFVRSRERQVQALATSMERPPIVVAPYDAELFGHWWYEGPAWLEAVLRAVASVEGSLELVSLGDWVARHPTQQVAEPAESSWGEGGAHAVWLSEEAGWLWPHAHRAAERMAALARAHASTPSPQMGRALGQAARELLLAQASDWAFLIRMGTAREYAAARARSHLRRFHHLADQVERGVVDEAWLGAVEEEDNLFPEIDWRRWFDMPS
jgi:1,4-alpha-glucan branching enzyme